MAGLNVRNIPEPVLERLRAQAGVSVSEWVRIALAERADLIEIQLAVPEWYPTWPVAGRLAEGLQEPASTSMPRS